MYQNVKYDVYMLHMEYIFVNVLRSINVRVAFFIPNNTAS